MSKIRFRVVAATAAAALSGLSLTLLAPPANAAVTNTTVAANSQPTIAIGKNGQAVGSWTVTQSGGTVTNGDTFSLTVGPAANCVASGNQTWFSAAPTVTVSAPSPTPAGYVAPTYTAALSATAGCSGTFTNTLTLTATSPSGASPSIITISNVQYSIGPSVAGGPVTVVAGGNGSTNAPTCTGATGCSNAIVSAVVATANTPPSAVQVPNGNPGAGGATASAQPISNFVVTEGQAGALAAGSSVCFSITSGNASFTTPTSTAKPSVAATGGGAATMVSPNPSATQIAFTVNTASTSPGVYTVSGILVDTTAQGAILLSVTQTTSPAAPCSAPPAATFATGLPAGAVISVVRLAGSNRFDTARLLGDKKFPCAGTPTTNRFAIVARGDAFPDALAGAYLAGKHPTAGGAPGAPILLTNTDSLPNETITAFHDMGINQVIILGLQGAVDDNVANQIKAIQSVDCTGAPVTNASGGPVNITVQRIGGGDRFETARLVAENPGLGAAGTLTPNGLSTGTAEPTAILAFGGNFPDALSAGPIAFLGTHGANGAGGLPLLLTNQDQLSPSAQQGINDLGIKQVLIPGGTAAVSANVATTLTNEGINVVRFAGADRTDTAGKVAAFETAVASASVGGLSYNTNFVQVARGDNFPDALAGGPYAGVTIAPVLLTGNPDSAGQFTDAYLAANDTIHFGGAGGPATGIGKFAIFGGAAAVDSNAQNEMAGALSG